MAPSGTAGTSFLLLALGILHCCRCEASLATRTSDGRGVNAEEEGLMSHERVKRGWVWNQFFVVEEYTGTEPLYVGKIHSDSDEGDGSIKYTISGEGAGTIFIIDQITGDIHATERLDREEKTYYTLRAQARDPPHRPAPRTRVRVRHQGPGHQRQRAQVPGGPVHRERGRAVAYRANGDGFSGPAIKVTPNLCQRQRLADRQTDGRTCGHECPPPKADFIFSTPPASLKGPFPCD
ncbi:hypothetical protein SKAU_G00286640 [Synaphobranchus kaupii]|uniref:Cadherin domain-containing protein n=1 Tax=Synaphobranchus kaupii TaxID=118154 RepID=A0A9Q1EYC9_SYNKA|nr:hypothetical protein SKAU_G00286640 [Synaphobranchus kaupii]